MIKQIFNSQTKTVTFAAFLLAFSGLASRVLGLIRDRLLAGRFGAGSETDIYFAAFRIPDFVYGIVIVGGITAAFLPIFAEYFNEKENKEKKGEWSKAAIEFTNNVLNCFFVFLVLICGVLALLAPLLVNFFIAPGFSAADKELTVLLTRLMFFSPVLFGLSSIFSGILQYFNKFLIYSLAPIFYNLGIIFGILVLVPAFGVFGLAYGVILGAFFHLLVQIPAAFSSGFKYKWFLNFKCPGLKKIFSLMAPRAIGTAAYQINLIIVTAIASTLIAGSVSVFNYSNNLYYFPIGLIGVSFAVSSFPVFSRFCVSGRKEEFLENFSSSLRQILFFVVPAVFLLFILRAQVVRLVFGVGQFDWLATRLTAASLGIFCLGIIAASITPLLTRAFFALKDTKTPVVVSIFSMVLNIGLCFLFTFLLKFPNVFKDFWAGILKLQDINHFEVIGLVLALSLSAIFELISLSFLFRKKIGDFGLEKIWQSFIKILFSGFLMALFVYILRQILGGLVNMNTFGGVFWQTFISGSAGILFYLFLARLLKTSEIKLLKTAVLRQFIKIEYDKSETN